MKSSLSIIVFSLLFVFISCKKGKEDGKCEYVELNKNVIVSFIDGDLNSEFTASFQATDPDTDEVYRLNNTQFKKVKINFDISELQNKKNIFTLIIAERTTGSCIPFIIKKILLN